MTDLISLARQNGFTHVAPVDLSAAVPLAEVRDMCTADRCGCFGKNWACPPHCGTVEQAARRLAQYHAGVLVQTTGELADPFDYDGMTALSRLHRRRFLNFARQARLVSPRLSAPQRRTMHPVRPVYLPGQTLPPPQAAPVLDGGLWPVRQRRVHPFGPLLQLWSQHPDLYRLCVL